MEPITMGLVGAGLGALGRLLGEAFSAGDKAAAEAIRRQILEQYGPDALAKAQEEAQVGPSAFEGYQADPQGMAAQRLALQQLQEDSTTQGLTALERAEMAEAQDDASQFEQGQRGAIMQNALMRGMGGSGAELAAQLTAQQGSAQRASKAATQSAANAARRRALATMQAGELGGAIRGQGFQEFGAKASAQDSIAKFNAQNRRDIGSEFRGGTSQALTQQANALEGRADDTANTWSDVGSAGNQVLGTYSKYEHDEEMRRKYGGKP